MRHAYLTGNYVAASRRYGMFIHTPDGPDLVGVAVFAIPAQAKVLINVFPGLRPYVESLELARFVLEGQPLPWVSGLGETWFLAECLRCQAGDGVAGVVSFV